ncbi:hypothetical protein [Aquicoccus sp. SU-CL01552]|uniref:hypothetical protein n=1 Tax=Aquicoccus sp. SU-CL01552 TaxID=3127656 RepID=UPI0031061212
MDDEIAGFMLMAAKFEFFLINLNPNFAHVHGKTKVVTGVNWDRVSESLEDIHPFDEFRLEDSGFQTLKETAPHFLIEAENGGFRWDSDEVKITSWQILLRRGYAQLRNNVAHGNKAQLPAPFTAHRTKEFLAAGHNLIHFIAATYSQDDMLRYPVQFR